MVRIRLKIHTLLVVVSSVKISVKSRWRGSILGKVVKENLCEEETF